MARETHQKVWVLLLGEVIGAADPAVGGGAVGHGPAVLGELAVEPVEVFVIAGAGGVGEFEDVETEALALGMEVELADHASFVAGSAEFACQGGGRVPGGAHEADHAVFVGRAAGHEDAAGGDAGRGFGVAAAEEGAGGAEPVHGGGLQDGVAVDAEAVAALLVGDDEQHVGAALVLAHAGHPVGRQCLTVPRWGGRLNSLGGGGGERGLRARKSFFQKTLEARRGLVRRGLSTEVRLRQGVRTRKCAVVLARVCKTAAANRGGSPKKLLSRRRARGSPRHGGLGSTGRGLGRRVGASATRGLREGLRAGHAQCTLAAYQGQTKGSRRGMIETPERQGAERVVAEVGVEP